MPLPTRRSLLATFATLPVLAAAPANATRRRLLPPDSDLWGGLALQDQSGHSFQLNQAGRPTTIVSLWAHWCQPCLAEIPALTRLAAELGDRAEIVLMSHPEYFAEDVALARRRHIGLRIVTPTPANGQSTIQAALLNAHGQFEVPRSLTYRTNDGQLAWHNSIPAHIS